MLELFLCLIFCLHYFFIDVERCICSICVIGAFISYQVIELYSTQFSSGSVCRIFWIFALAVSKSILIPQSSVIVSEQVFSGRCGGYLLAGFCLFLAVIFSSYNAVKTCSFLCFSDLNSCTD